MSENKTLVEVKNLKQYFPITTGFLKTTMLKAVDDVSFSIKKGETLGLVGESGCGKTTVGRTLLHLYEPTGGSFKFKGEEVTSKNIGPLRKEMQMVFQDPYSSLNPRMTVEDIIGEPLDVHHLYENKEDRHEQVLHLMELVGLNAEHATRYAHEFSGGQRQRIGIARALAVHPSFIVCDEPVSALDASVQAQTLNLLKDMQESMGLSYLFISHDLSVVKFISDKIGVMYLGSMVEFGAKEDIFSSPLHPYTKALFSAIPNPNPSVKMNRVVLKGDIPSPANPPSGCRFHTRCPNATERCKTETPAFREYKPGHFAACHLCEDAEYINNCEKVDKK